MKTNNIKRKILFIVISSLLIVAVGIVILINTPQYKLLRIGYSNSEIRLILDSIDRRDIQRYINYSIKNDLPIEDIILIIINNADKYDFSEELLAILRHPDFQKDRLSDYMAYHLRYSEAKIEHVIFLINKDINNEYSLFLVEIAKERYFIRNRLDRYLEHALRYPDKSSVAIVREVNCNVDFPFYTNIEYTDITKGPLILLNKFYRLTEYFKPNLVQIDMKYTFNRVKKMDETAYRAFVRMANDAEKVGIRLGIVAAYRSYQEQKQVYNDFVNMFGFNITERYVARPGHSEHQTGLALDMRSRNNPNTPFSNTREFIWMKENAHNYGFILRYPRGKEYLTGYNYEPWHWRYVGVRTATYIHENNILFEEYFAFYVLNN